MERTPEQAAHEAALREVYETMLNIEQAVRRAERAHRHVKAKGDEWNLELGLSKTIEGLKATHKELMQLTYFPGPQQRMF